MQPSSARCYRLRVYDDRAQCSESRRTHLHRNGLTLGHAGAVAPLECAPPDAAAGASLLSSSDARPAAAAVTAAAAAAADLILSSATSGREGLVVPSLGPTLQGSRCERAGSAATDLY